MDWADAMQLEQVAPDAFRTTIGEEWSSLQGAHGGVVAALAMTAASRVVSELGVDPTTTVRAATFGYARGNTVGDLHLDVDVVRQGRSLVTTHVRASQGGRTTTVARLHHSTPWDGAEFSDAPPPPARPEGTVRLEWPGPAHLNNVETHLHPDTLAFAGAPRAEWIAWSRPLQSGSFDTAWLAMFGDYFPPAVFTRGTGPSRAVTIEYSIQFHSADGGWELDDDEHLTARMHAFHAHEGFAVEDGWIWLPDGALLATTRQTRLAG